MFKFFFKTLLMFKRRMYRLYLHVNLSQLCPNFSQYDNSNTFLTCWGQSYKGCVITTSLLGLRLRTTFNKSRIPIVTKSVMSKRAEVFNMVLVLMCYQKKVWMEWPEVVNFEVWNVQDPSVSESWWLLIHCTYKYEENKKEKRESIR